MRFQKVNEHTVRIFISLTELSERDITMADLSQQSAKTEQLFWELIAQAREEVEFNLDQPFWIQATVASNDEFVITIMKQEEQLVGSNKEKTTRKPTKARITELVYVFTDFEDVLPAVRSLPEFAQLHSGLYLFEEEYYLVLSRMGTSKKRQIAEAILDEYGEVVTTTGIFLSEHGKAIIPTKAVEILNTSFGPALSV